jgi:hypothetical protein
MNARGGENGQRAEDRAKDGDLFAVPETEPRETAEKSSKQPRGQLAC